MAPGRGPGHLCWWPLIFTDIQPFKSGYYQDIAPLYQKQGWGDEKFRSNKIK